MPLTTPRAFVGAAKGEQVREHTPRCPQKRRDNKSQHVQVLQYWVGRLRDAASDAETLAEVRRAVGEQPWEAGPVAPLTTAEALVGAVRGLIAEAAGARMASAALRNADEELKKNPQGGLQVIVRHFQELFDVPSVQGCIPVMSKVRWPFSQRHVCKALLATQCQHVQTFLGKPERRSYQHHSHKAPKETKSYHKGGCTACQDTSTQCFRHVKGCQMPYTYITYNHLTVFGSACTVLMPVRL